MINYSSYTTPQNLTIPGVVKMQSVQVATIVQLPLEIAVTAGKTVYLNWGNGSIVTLNATGNLVTVTSNYVTNNTTYNIELTGDVDYILQFQCQNKLSLKVNIDEFRCCKRLTNLTLNGIYNNMTGNLNYLPSTLTKLVLNPTTNSYGNAGSNQVTGTNVIFPSGLTYFALDNLAGYIDGVDTEKVTFSINNLPSGLTRFSISQVGNQNYGITGSIDNMPSGMVYWGVQGLWGITSEGGTLPSSLTTFYMENVFDDNLVGNLDNMLPDTLQTLFLVGNADVLVSKGQLTFTTAGLPSSLTFLWVTNYIASGSGSINSLSGMSLANCILSILDGSFTGNIENLPSTIVDNIYLAGLGTGITYGGGAVPAWGTGITVQAGMTTSAVDNFIIAFAAVAPSVAKTLNLAGTNQARSAASDAAKATLEGKGWTVTTN